MEDDVGIQTEHGKLTQIDSPHGRAARMLFKVVDPQKVSTEAQGKVM
jgi:hypothetical protein